MGQTGHRRSQVCDGTAPRKPGTSRRSPHAKPQRQVDRAILRPLSERADDGGPDLEALSGLRLTIGRPPEPLDLSGPPPAKEAGGPKGSRLGAMLGVKADDDERLASLRGNIRDGKWSPSDILPMLVIGSTPDLAMRITRPRSERVTEFVAPLEEALLPFVRLFAADPEATLDLGADASLLSRVSEGEALRTRAVHLVGRRDGNVEYMDLVGQPSRRLLACGLLGTLNDAADSTVAKSDGPDLRRLLRAIRAADQLDAELTAAGGLDPIRQTILNQTAAPLAAAIASIQVPDTPEARRLAGLVACRADRMGLLDAAAAFNGPKLENTPVGVLATRLETAASLHLKLDSSIAPATIKRYMHHELQEADDELWLKIETRLAGNSYVLRCLSELIWKAPDGDALRELLASHAPMGGQRTAILLQQFAGATDLQVKLRIATAINGLRKSGVGFVAHLPGGQRRVPRTDAEVERLAKLVEDPRIHALLARREDLLPSAEPFLDVELGYFDPATVEVRNIVDLVLED